MRLEVVPDDGLLVDDSDPRLKYSGQWQTLWSQNAQYKGTSTVGGAAGSSAELSFEGNGIAWTGGTVRASGEAGAEEAANLDLTRRVETRCSDVWPLVLFSKQGLAEGRHTIKIVVRSAGVPIDEFQILRRHAPGDVRMVYANQWNYPDLSWGNYVKPPQITGTFYYSAVRVRLTGPDSDERNELAHSRAAKPHSENEK